MVEKPRRREIVMVRIIRFAPVAVLLAATALHAVAQDMGVTVESGTTTFRVWAPHASSVAVIGDFNGWKAMQGDHLTREGDTGIWSLTVRRSRPKGAYQFLINGQLARRDPYARAVTPDGLKTLFYAPREFDWKNDRSPAHALEDTIIYEMHIGAFFDPKPDDGMPATFDDAARRLDHLVNLGVNTLCLLPVHEFAGHHSWGYNPSDPFAVEQSYGGPDGLKKFVQLCHARGLAVHLDIVHNHYGPQNLHLLKFDGTGGDTSGGIYFYDGDGIAMTPWGPRPRFSEPMVRKYVQDNALMWLEEYRVDGFRWDSTINIRAYNFGARPIPDGAGMLETINAAIRERHPGKWSIAEDSLNIGNFDASWDYDFHHQIMPQLSARKDADRNLHQISKALTRRGRMARVVYVDNHDEAGKMNGQSRIATDVDPADPGGDKARKLSAIGAVFTFTAPGIPLLFMGNEFQEYGNFHDDRPLDWSKVIKHAGQLELHRDLIALRKNTGGFSPGLKGREIQIPVSDHDRKLLVYWRWHEKNSADRTVVAINLSGETTDMLIPFPSDGPWLMRMHSDWQRYGGATRQEPPKPFKLDPQSATAKTVMPPYSARIYTLVSRPSPGQASTARPTAKPSPVAAAKPPFSMYAGIHLSGNFNGWSLTNWAFRLVADHQWEGRFSFRETESPAFKISANDSGVIYWGGHDGKLDAGENSNLLVKRLGKNFAGAGTWNGTYLFRFHEDLLTLDIEKLPDESPTRPAKTEEVSPGGDEEDGFRMWTDSRGGKIDARMSEANAVMVTLEDRGGKQIQIPINRFSESDQEYIRDRMPPREP